DGWVLGETKELAPDELSAMAANFRTRFIADYQKAWNDYLGAAAVNPYANLQDAASKLEKMSGTGSFLLKLLGIATEHTAPFEGIKVVFAPTKAVAPTTEEFNAGE